MDRAYYYFAASLPTLSFEGEPPLSADDFLQDCRRLLDPRDYRLIEEILTKDEYIGSSGNGVYDAWARFDRGFRNELTWVRAERAGKEPADYIRGDRYSDPYFSEMIQQALKEDNLLEAEKILDRYRWNFLDDLQTKNAFNFGFILIYGLKLKILLRYERIDSPKGPEILDELCRSAGRQLSAVTGEAHDILVTIKSEE